jgi:threonine dehydratase
MLSFKVDSLSRPTEVKEVLAALEALDMKGYDISDDEFAKSHARYMIGGCHVVPDERVFRFGTFPVSDGCIIPEFCF